MRLGLCVDAGGYAIYRIRGYTLSLADHLVEQNQFLHLGYPGIFGAG